MAKVRTIAELRAAVGIGVRQLDAGEGRPLDETTFNRIKAMGLAKRRAHPLPTLPQGGGDKVVMAQDMMHE